MTVNELHIECEKLIKKGLGDKEVLISDDDEGNGYHGLFYTFQTNQVEISACADDFHDNDNPENVVLLG